MSQNKNSLEQKTLSGFWNTLHVLPSGTSIKLAIEHSREYFNRDYILSGKEVPFKERLRYVTASVIDGVKLASYLGIISYFQ